MSTQSDSADAAIEDPCPAPDTDEQFESTADRRAQKRHVFQCTQLIATYDGEHLPRQADFRHVFCLDISGSGFSFLTLEPPDYDQVVVAFGEIPFKFFVAKIQHSTPICHDGIDQFTVGCRLLNRI